MEQYQDEMIDEETEVSINMDKGISYKDIVMNQFKKITFICNTEFRGGFYQTKFDTRGKATEVYVPDSREVFNNAVYSFALVLIPRFDDVMKEAFKTYKQKNKENKEWFLKNTSIEEEVVLGEPFYENIKDKILLETYKEKKLVIYQYLFKELSKLLARLNYFDYLGGTYA